MDKANYYQKDRDVLLNKSKEYYRNNKERIRNKSLSEDGKNYQKNVEKTWVMNKNKNIEKLKNINIIT